MTKLTKLTTAIKKINDGDWIFNGYTYDDSNYYAIIDAPSTQ